MANVTAGLKTKRGGGGWGCVNGRWCLRVTFWLYLRLFLRFGSGCFSRSGWWGDFNAEGLGGFGAAGKGDGFDGEFRVGGFDFGKM